MPRYSDDDDYDFDARPVRRARRRKRGTKLALPLPVVLALGLAGLLIFLAFVIRGSALAIMWVGLAVCIVAQLWFLLVAASDSAGQLLLCLFIPFYSLFYLIMNWEETKWAFGLDMLGVFILVGSLIAGAVREGISKSTPEKPALASTDQDTTDDGRPSNDPSNPAQPFDVDPNAKAAGKTVYLAVLTPYAYRAGPWKLGIGVKGEDGKSPLFVQKQQYKYGISMHPPQTGTGTCRVSFVPGGEFKRFRGWAGIGDYHIDPRGSVILSVYGDGVLLWESGALNKSGDVEEFDIKVAGVKVLTLETRMKDGRYEFAHAVWLDPWLER